MRVVEGLNSTSVTLFLPFRNGTTTRSLNMSSISTSSSNTTPATTTLPVKHCLVLDVDHTFLSGVTEEMYQAYSPTSSFCQSLTYDPSAKRRAKYIKRAQDENSSRASGKMVHYTMPNPDDGKSLTFFVAVRPCITYLVSRHDELFNKDTGHVTILLASANDDERTLAVLDALTYEGRTLAEISHARFIPRAEFLNNFEKSRSGQKRIHDIRRWAESQHLLTSDGRMLFLDDKAPKNCCGRVTNNDYPCFITSWDLPESLQIFEQHKQHPNIDRVDVPPNDAGLMQQVVDMFAA